MALKAYITMNVFYIFFKLEAFKNPLLLTYLALWIQGVVVDSTIYIGLKIILFHEFRTLHILKETKLSLE